MMKIRDAGRGCRGAACALPLALACWATLAQADVYVRHDGGTLVLTNVPDAAHYEVMLAEPVDPVASAPAAAVAAPAVRGGDARAVAAASRPAAGGGVTPYLGHVRAAASRHGVPEALLHAVIRVESNFNPQAVSPRGARGLMQLMPATAAWLGVRDAFDPAANIDAGARYLRHLLDQFDHDVRLALAAYNAGPENVKRWGGVPRFAETERYVPRVLGHFEALGGRLPSRWR